MLQGPGARRSSSTHPVHGHERAQESAHVVQNVAAIEDEGGLDHALVDRGIVQALKFLPLCQHAQRVAPLASVIRRALVGHLRFALHLFKNCIQDQLMMPVIVDAAKRAASCTKLTAAN